METKTKRRLTGGLGGVLILGLAFAVFFRQNFFTVQVTGNSMDPTFKNGQRLLATRAYWLVGEIRKGDVVVFKGQKEPIIKRVVGLGGDSIDWLNVPNNWKLASGEYIVPPGTAYVLGDNRRESEDSRAFGPLPIKNALGKVVLLR